MKRSGVSVEVSTKDIIRFIRRGGAEVRRMAKRAAGQAATTCQRQVQKIMRMSGGEYGVPKFRPYNPFTLEIHNGWSGRKIGGILADRKFIKKWRRGGVQYIGWPNGLGEYADKFQEGRGGSDSERMFKDPGYRRALHKRGIKDIPREYVHNPRQVLSVYAEHMTKNLEEYTNGALKRMVSNAIVKAAKGVN